MQLKDTPSDLCAFIYLPEGQRQGSLADGFTYDSVKGLTLAATAACDCRVDSYDSSVTTLLAYALPHEPHLASRAKADHRPAA